MDTWAALTSPWKMSGEAKFFKSVGCEKCRDTGFLGRSGIYEMMKMTPTLREKIKPDSDALEIRKAAIEEGMTQLRIAGARKIAMGQTTIDEVLKVVPPDSEI